ncbi:hypothetical protein J2W37_003700 [Variovorax paradoxus]|uniref:hypothetical protein n=1 Tax=Variovorax paradoxus TaxID=34073 RepID=UPI0027894758|nr:hypothetical protein [Variovorax paradoxus]MDP9965973.1 hypothetical protein [Variovorax paradoxus]
MTITGRRERWAVAVVAVLLFVWTHPYNGIRHDGMLYVAQALRHIDPTIFDGDLFFKYGSQDSFSIFGRAYALAVVAFGVAWSSLAGVLIGQILFIVAAGLLIWRVLPENSRAWACCILALTAGTYGSLSLIHFAEPFLTARTYAEVLVLFGLTLMARRQLAAAAAVCVAAALIHPLMALGAVLLCWALAVQKHRGWLWLLASSVLAFALGYLGVAPFDRAFLFYDSEWRQLVDRHNFVFMMSWPLASWLALVADLVLLGALALNQRDPYFSKLLKTLFVVAILCIGVALLGSDVLSNVLVTSLQLWRVQWLVHLVALVFLAPELLRAWHGTRLEKLAAALLTYAVLFQDFPTGSLAMLMGLALLYVGAARNWHLSRITLSFSVMCLILAGGYNSWKQTALTLRMGEYLTGGASVGIFGKVVVFFHQAPVGPLLLGLIAIGLIWFFRRSMTAISVTLMGLAAITAANWDRRPEITKIVENIPVQGPHVFSDIVPRDAEVYWQGDALAPWLLMHRRSYASSVQAAGLVFNRGTAIELDRRRDVTSVFDVQREVCGLLNALREDKGSCEPDVSGLELTCEADPLLGYIVMPTKLEGWVLASWTPRILEARSESSLKTYYLYSCAQLTAKSRTIDSRALNAS